MKITNLLLWVKDIKLSLQFYKKLGFDILRSDESHAVITLGGFEIMLVNARGEEFFAHDADAGAKGKGVYIYIEANDVDEIYASLLKKDIKPTTKPNNWHWGNREFIAKDPDGYKLCFWQKISW